MDRLIYIDSYTHRYICIDRYALQIHRWMGGLIDRCMYRYRYICIAVQGDQLVAA